MILETTRLLLRPWEEGDAESLYKYAKDPDVGPAAGWPPHTGVEDSRNILRTVLMIPGCFAVCLKETGEAVGSISIMGQGQSNLTLPENEMEIGCWIGRPHWGKGLMPEAARALIEYGFDTLGLDKIWYIYSQGNDKSARVAEKCGFVLDRTEEKWSDYWQTNIKCITCLPRATWEGRRA